MTFPQLFSELFARLQYFPLPPLFLLGLLLLAVVAILLVEIGVLGYAYEKIGIRGRYVFALLILSLLGSHVNIPVAQIASRRVLTEHAVNFFGMRYVIPTVVEWPGTVIAVNLGGAVIPVLLSIYLILRNRLYGRTVLGVTVVTLVVHALARPMPGMGIAVPIFVPPIVAALVAILLARHRAPALAYASGTLGTLIGADLLNLGAIPALGAPVASIGGAGTFDGVFLTGILAVLLA